MKGWEKGGLWKTINVVDATGESFLNNQDQRDRLSNMSVLSCLSAHFMLKASRLLRTAILVE